eukprot:TRINITY_DN3936_c0_g1_i1.p1 TRINITY_DN3936_c0_g1~~TRINITY_DN3936_c0_g1_i1.p1  ORF type:complete len:309 (-),score=71.24 TRINITY_DN3936_c0_g1_i1:1586-2512(-)
MRKFKKFLTNHDDIVHDTSYDFYGKRLATCSSDRKIKVFDLDESGEWQCSSEWVAHDGPVYKVVWAHPEFGQIIASCSFDREVCIWEEIEDDGRREWKERIALKDSTDSVLDIEFAPRHLGLKLSTCSMDGYVRIYNSIDMANLQQWPLSGSFEVERYGGVKCLSWNTSPFEDSAKIVVGTTNECTIQIWEYIESQNRWTIVKKLIGHEGPIRDVAWAPHIGRSYHVIASSSEDKTIKIWNVYDDDEAEVEAYKSFDLDTDVYRVEWNVTGTVLATSDDNGKVHLWRRTALNDWKCLLRVRSDQEYSN